MLDQAPGMRATNRYNRGGSRHTCFHRLLAGDDKSECCRAYMAKRTKC